MTVFGFNAPLRPVRVINTVHCEDCNCYHVEGDHFATLTDVTASHLLTEGTPLHENLWPEEHGGEA